MKALISSVVVAAAVLVAPVSAQITLNIVPAQSSLTAGGTVSGFNLTPQGTGANVTSYSGTVVISDPRTGGGTFSFISANGIAANSGNWQPLPGGAAGSAPANYGLRQTLLGVVAALRNARFGLTSGPLALSGGSMGTFPASQVTGTALAGDNDYNATALGLVGTGSIAGSTSPAAGAGANGNIQIVGSTITLTLPANMTLTQVVNGITIVVTLTGQLVATGTLPALTGACCQGSTCAVTTAAACPTQANQRFVGVGTACNVPGNNTMPCCKADFNQSGGGAPVTVQDIFDFLSAYFSSNPLADINGAGGVSVQDIFDFLAAYFAGC